MLKWKVPFQKLQFIFDVLCLAATLIILHFFSRYGELSPSTFPGKLIGGLCALCGIFILTLPIPIVVNSFASYYKNRLWRNEVIFTVLLLIPQHQYTSHFSCATLVWFEWINWTIIERWWKNFQPISNEFHQNLDYISAGMLSNGQSYSFNQNNVPWKS